ncbi:MAG TPA: hypothetical protein VJ783_29640 [Pirellulales bacterium]|nr:hypothetical protein [Pirellulales bacterium]
MPRIKTGVGERPRRADITLVDQLAVELKNGRESGQPTIYEQEFPTGKLRVTVVWDAWDHLPLEERTEIILRAYEQAEDRAFRERIALASGLMVSEAHAAGMLPVRIITALRHGDPVTIEQCRQAMIDEGASTLPAGAGDPQLRLATIEDAEAARRRLVKRLPGSDPVWVISQDVGSVEEWQQR